MLWPKPFALLPSQFLGLRLSAMPAFTESRLTIPQLQGGTVSLGLSARCAVHTVMHVEVCMHCMCMESCPLQEIVR